jgi:hypothetical protein
MMGYGCSPVIEHLPSMCEPQGLFLREGRGERENSNQDGRKYMQIIYLIRL